MFFWPGAASHLPGAPTPPRPKKNHRSMSRGFCNKSLLPELVAISSSLDHVQHDDCIIATDSLASMYMIQKQLTILPRPLSLHTPLCWR